MTRHKAFAVFDGDTHVVEPPAVWEEYLAPEFRTLGKTALWREEGRYGSTSRSTARCFGIR